MNAGRTRDDFLKVTAMLRCNSYAIQLISVSELYHHYHSRRNPVTICKLLFKTNLGPDCSGKAILSPHPVRGWTKSRGPRWKRSAFGKHNQTSLVVGFVRMFGLDLAGAGLVLAGATSTSVTRTLASNSSAEVVDGWGGCGGAVSV